MMKLTKLAMFLLLALWTVACNSPEFTSAKMYVNENNLEKAEEFFKMAMNIEPENALVPYLLGKEVYYEQGRYEEMLDMFEEALRRNPDQNLESFYTVDDKWIRTVSDAIVLYRDAAWSKIFNSGVDSYKDQDFESAISSFELALRMLPDNGDTYGTLANLYMVQGEKGKAASTIQKGIEVAPENCNVVQAAADIYSRNNEQERAAEMYQKALGICDNPGPILRKLIQTYIDLKDYDQAIETSMQAMREYPNDPDIYYNVGVLYQILANDVFEPARREYLSIIESSERDQDKLSDIYNQFMECRRHYNEAKDYFSQACDLEIKDLGGCDAVKQVRLSISTLDDTYIPSVRDMMD